MPFRDGSRGTLPITGGLVRLGVSSWEWLAFGLEQFRPGEQNGSWNFRAFLTWQGFAFIMQALKAMVPGVGIPQ